MAEKGVHAERRAVNIGPPMENYEPWYARKNPRMVIPTLEHDGALICDSAAILRYIDATFDGPELLPEAAAERATVEAIVDEIDRLQIRELSYKGMRGPLGLARDRLLMPMRVRALRKHRAAAPELAPLYDARLEDVATWVGTMASEASIAEARRSLHAALEGLESRLRGGASYLVGDAYSLADLMATVLCARLLALGIAELSAYPALMDHYGRMKARPNFPEDDIVESLDRRRLIRIIAPFVLPRLLTVLLLLTALILLLRLAC